MTLPLDVGLQALINWWNFTLRDVLIVYAVIIDDFDDTIVDDFDDNAEYE